MRRFNATTEAEYHRAVDEGLPVTVATPDLVAPEIWNHLGSRPRFAARYWPGADPHINEWHKHNPPPGTAFNPAPRLDYLVNRPRAATVLGELHVLAPYDAPLADALVACKYRGSETFEQAEEILRPLLEYSARPNLRLAKCAAADPVRYEETMVRYAKLNPAGYFTLGAVEILWKFQGTGSRALLGGDEIKHPVAARSAADVLQGDLPGFVQSKLGISRGQIDEPIDRSWLNRVSVPFQ